ncbi:MAG: transposase, partial [Chloroflexi bacterium]|nr:transposase [Chloroflexota bacterium]
MYKENTEHLQIPMMSDLDKLSDKSRKRLEESWAGDFRRDIFSRIDESIYAVLYSDIPSRPNEPINVLVGLEILKSGYGWTDHEMYEHYLYDMQVRYALGYSNFGEGEFDLRTVYNFRARLTNHMEETGENLIEKTFEQITDEQIEAYQLKTGKQRMDSTQMGSNIRDMSRLQLLVEVLQRVYRMFDETDQAQYAETFAPYLKGSSGQYINRIKGEDTDSHLKGIGDLMQPLVEELHDKYQDDPTYATITRV